MRMVLKRYEAVKGLIQYGDKYLIVKQDKFIGGEYEVPGGRKNSPNESDEDALKREISEEVGLEVKIFQQLNEWSLQLPQFGIHLDGKTYFCKSYSNDVTRSEEHVYHEWVSMQKLEKLDIPPWLRDAIVKLKEMDASNSGKLGLIKKIS